MVEEGVPAGSVVGPLVDDMDQETINIEGKVNSRATQIEGAINTTLNEADGVEGEVERPLNDEHSSDNEDFEEDNLENIYDEDGSEIEEELRAFRETARKEKISVRKTKKRRKANVIQEVELGEAGVDKGFEDLGLNKKDRFVGKLGGDEDFIYSSDDASEDSSEDLDVLAQPGVDLPSRRKSKKLRNKSTGIWHLYRHTVWKTSF
ncbi:PREDICTED: uncharacterized protein LOC109240922 isoform X2 [Nicotiana attenuata]|uniref:uncharacterized protein LOC109240922 isoform X2 n=1 Tax=Nicotiana attenuata TaxID=49451 RepID=UPI00090566E3|nr:PREDICTED: uncharacterized protein LOC109240922 isoform X2 [Nicotiana attenuata]